MSSLTVEVLQAAFTADPNAIHALLINRVPCNQALDDDPFVQVDISLILPPGNWQVGALGLVNAVLAANGLPLVAAKYTDEKYENGRLELVEAHAPFACGWYGDDPSLYALWQIVAWENRQHWLI